MKSQLLIPKKCKVGFNLRSDTYTGKLGYVILHDGKIWRKESSWDSWRDKKVNPVEIENVPHSGFHLNKGIERYGYWGSGRSMCRVYDDRGFEFEITIDNLMFILMGSDCSKRELAGEFVYSWNGTELVLLPTNSEEYKSSQKFSKLQSDKVSAKDLIPGATYQTKGEEALIYLGKFNVNSFDEHYVNYKLGTSKTCSIRNKFVFYTPSESTKYSNYQKSDNYHYQESKFLFFSDVKHLANCLQEEPVAEYANLVDKFLKTSWGSKVSNVEAKTVEGSYLLSSFEERNPTRNNWGYNLPEKKVLIDEVFEQVDETTFKLIQIHGISKFTRDHTSSSYGHLKIVSYEVTSPKTLYFMNDTIVAKDNAKKDNKVCTESEIKSLSLVKLVISLERGTKHNLKP